MTPRSTATLLRSYSTDYRWEWKLLTPAGKQYRKQEYRKLVRRAGKLFIAEGLATLEENMQAEAAEREIEARGYAELLDSMSDAIIDSYDYEPYDPEYLPDDIDWQLGGVFIDLEICECPLCRAS